MPPSMYHFVPNGRHHVVQTLSRTLRLKTGARITVPVVEEERKLVGYMDTDRNARDVATRASKAMPAAVLV